MQDAIEECRKLCGGHGYLCSSGLPELFAVYVPACTYEGDNVVLLLQVMISMTLSIIIFLSSIYAYIYPVSHIFTPGILNLWGCRKVEDVIGYLSYMST